MTRDEKVLLARELRAEGLTAPEIAKQVGVSDSTVRNWYLGGECEDCGAPIDGSSGAKSKTRRCPPCASAANTIWTEDRILDSMHAWDRLYNRSPSVDDWSPHHVRQAQAKGFYQPKNAKVKIKRFRQGDWPPYSCVRERFGTWSKALEIAGLPQNPTGPAGHWKAA